ncbi:hypothetical protein RHSIM_Rhsim06G0060600 [Rhododendron simsii]|uniref:Uncharacterized protein n=1 Tax=Rhododendron simsii TaxID=118357 RepID=A0A834GSQ5_RHOSS|nr:hypothetical protein RHSIM_Rhsim06G0060600 [Rhododendron simsii]
MDYVRVVDPFAKGLSVLWKKDLKVSFVDLGYIGYPFTWVNKHMGDGLIKERLDRVLVSTEWRAWYDGAQVQHLFSVGLDHAALLQDTNPTQSKQLRPFRFYCRWASDPKSREVIQNGWSGEVRSSKMYKVFQ